MRFNTRMFEFGICAVSSLFASFDVQSMCAVTAFAQAYTIAVYKGIIMFESYVIAVITAANWGSSAVQ